MSEPFGKALKDKLENLQQTKTEEKDKKSRAPCAKEIQKKLEGVQRRIQHNKKDPYKYCQCRKGRCAECRFLRHIRENVPEGTFLPPQPDPKHPELTVQQQIEYWVNNEDAPIPKRKVLCLHDTRDTALSFKAQTVGLRNFVGDGHEWLYVDGAIECINDLCESIPSNTESSGKLHSWMETSSPGDIQKAHKAVDTHIEEAGPFDGILGFGQGAAVATSYLIQRQLQNLPLQFDFAIISCSILVASHDENFASEFYRDFWLKYSPKIRERVRDFRVRILRSAEPSPIMEPVAAVDEPEPLTLNATREEIEDRREKTTAQRAMCMALNELTAALRSGETDLVEEIQNLRPDEFIIDSEMFPRLYHPELIPKELDIPSLHTWGENSALRTQAKLVARLYGPSNVIIRHSGHHDFGEQTDRYVEIALKIRQVMKQGLMESLGLKFEQYIERPFPQAPGPEASGLAEGFPNIDPSKDKGELLKKNAVIDYATSKELQGESVKVDQNNENQDSRHSPRIENIAEEPPKQTGEIGNHSHNKIENPEESSRTGNANDHGQMFEKAEPSSGRRESALEQRDASNQTRLRNNKENGKAIEPDHRRARDHGEVIHQGHNIEEEAASGKGQERVPRGDSPSRMQMIPHQGVGLP